VRLTSDLIELLWKYHPGSIILEISSWKYHPGKLEIKFNDFFIEQMRKTNFYRNIDFEEIKSLKSNIALRLYEYLLKQKLPFGIGIIKLGEKLTLAESNLYPSIIKPLLTRSLKEVNKKTSLKIDFSYNEKRKIITFFAMRPEIINKIQKEDIKKEDFKLADDTLFKENLYILPKSEYKKLKETAKNSLKDNVFIPEKLKKTKAIIEEEMLSIIKNQKQIKLLKK